MLKLNLGCGTVRLDGFVNVDIRFLPGVDRIEDIRYLRSFKNDSVDLIYACAVLEHLNRWEYKHALKRWYDLLKPGSILRISVPGWEDLVKHYNKHGDLRILMGMLYGGQDYEQNFHHHVWDFKIMEEDLLETGFKQVYRYDWRETEHAHVDDFSQSYLPHMDKDNGQLMHLNVEALK
jgi:predicted SAM-dependent methyltransferase